MKRLLYPLDPYLLGVMWKDALSELHHSYRLVACEELSVEHPLHVAQHALACWNIYLDDDSDRHKENFVRKACWLLENVVLYRNDVWGWPVQLMHLVATVPGADIVTRDVLSALMQSAGLAVFVRAYVLTREEVFLRAARQVVRAFQLDILDGGISSPVGEAGNFFEEIAMYPAKHSLGGHILALAGLSEYVAITNDSEIEALLEHGLATLSLVLDEFDVTYWTYRDLLSRRLTSRVQQLLSIRLLEILALYSGRSDFALQASRWATYQHSIGSHLRYQTECLMTGMRHSILRPFIQHMVFRRESMAVLSDPSRVCVPITAFPVAGGMRGVLAGVARVMRSHWRMTYMTHHKGQESAGLEIEVFGRGRVTTPWQFPFVWFYWLSGGYKLFKLLLGNPGIKLLLPQDGIYTAAYAAVVGKAGGARVVCMDHGNMTCFVNPAFQKEREALVAGQPWYLRPLARLQDASYWLSLRFFAWLATPLVDHFLVAGDEVEEVYLQHTGVRASQITRYAYIVDAMRYTPPGVEAKGRMRNKYGLSEDAIVITLINRLAPEKGLEFALQGIALALSELTPEVRQRVKVLIAGEGPLRKQIELDIKRDHLEATCVLWGEAKADDVVLLLAISDIFLYSGIRGTNYSMAVLEAMAAGCAVVASTEPRSNARLLAEDRGVAVKPGNVREIGSALTRLCCDLALCRSMGNLARAYVADYHGEMRLERTLLRTSFFLPKLVEQAAQVEEKVTVTHDQSRG